MFEDISRFGDLKTCEQFRSSPEPSSAFQIWLLAKTDSHVRNLGRFRFDHLVSPSGDVCLTTRKLFPTENSMSLNNNRNRSLRRLKKL
jgi:hypothetical protein